MTVFALLLETIALCFFMMSTLSTLSKMTKRIDKIAKLVGEDHLRLDDLLTPIEHETFSPTTTKETNL